MILESLVRHYDQLESDPDSEVAPFGYSLQQVGFCIVLNPDGTLHAIDELLDPTQDKPRPIKLVLPGQSKPSGSGINPCFLWDNPTYLLGHIPDGRDADWAGKRFEGFRDKHLSHRDQLAGDKGYVAVCTFLQAWNPAMLAVRLDTESLSRSGFGVFRLRGDEQYIHQRPAVDHFWTEHLLGAADAKQASPPDHSGSVCLITGNRGTIARLHEPKIKGVSGAQSSGATLVSFNDNAYESLGLKNGEVAPVSERAAFQYTTALNALLADRQHRVQLGDTTVVFWTEKPAGTREDSDPADALAEAFGIYREDKPADADDGPTRSALQDFLNRYRQGKADPTAARLEDAGVPFHVLGLSPNAARISVRIWMSCTVQELAQRLDRHIEALAMTGARDGQLSPTLRQLLVQTGREAKDIPPQLAGEYARSILQGSGYPLAFANAVLRRIVADRTINHPRAAGLKAWLVRNYSREVPVSLDINRTDTAYVLGRLFAAYERLQSDAFDGSLNRTIRDSYLASASTTPAAVFPRLYKLSQHHVGKLRRNKPGLAVVREKLIAEICGKLSEFPSRLSLPDQGLFAIGYYHQSQDFFTKKEPQPETNPVSEDN